MPSLLFRLRNVPDDEAEAVRRILSEHAFDYYETTAGSWGISTPAIWLKDGQDEARARALIADYQQQRLLEQRSQYEKLRDQGLHRTFADIFRENPVRVLLYLAFVGFLLYVTIRPFFGFGD